MIRSPSPILENYSASIADADELGYSRSKWVAERLCASASELLGMQERVKIVRVGQLTGDTKNGVWNMSEAWPLMLSTAKVLKGLPTIDQKLDWLPLDVAAEAVVDITLRDGARSEGNVYHVVNDSQGENWRHLLRWIESARSETLEVFVPTIWLRKLDSLEDHPAKKLLWLWRRSLCPALGQSGKGQPEFSTERAREVSKALREFKGVNEQLVHKIWTWLESEV